MADENNIPLNVSAETDDAKASLKKLADAIEKAVGSINKTIDTGLTDSVKRTETTTKKATESVGNFFGSLKTAAVAAVGFLAARELVGFLGDVISEASEADQNVQRLNVALASTGEFSQSASAALQQFASDIQAQTTLTDDAVLSALSLAKSFGISNDQAKNLTKSAVELSAATGVDLETAVSQLGGTLSGSVGKLAKLGPEFKNLTEQQLKAGAAIDIVRNRFDGFAEGLTNTFGGALKQAQNNFGEILESLGKAITQNPIVVATINALGKAFGRFAEFLGDNQAAISAFISNGIKFALGFVKPVLDGVDLMVKGFGILIRIVGSTFDVLFKISDFVFDVFRPVIEQLIDNFIFIGKIAVASFATVLEGITKLGNAVPFVRDSFAKFGIDLGETSKALEEFATTAAKETTKSNDGMVQSILGARAAFIDFTKGALFSAAQGVAGASDGFASFKESVIGAVDGILSVDDATRKAGASIQNQTKDTLDLAKANDLVKGSYDKLKNELETITKEIDKQTKSAFEQIKAEFKRGQTLADNAEIELIQMGKTREEAEKLTAEYRVALETKRQLAREQLSIGDFTLGEFGEGLRNQLAAFSSGVRNVKDAIAATFANPSSFNVAGIGEGLRSAASGLVDGFVDGMKKVRLGTVFAGLGNTITQSFEFGRKLLSGAFIDQFAGIVDGFANLPNNLLNAFKKLDEIVVVAIREFPAIMDELFRRLPDIAQRLGDALPLLFNKLASALPGILTALFSAIKPIISALFNEVIPTLIRALPGLIDGILKELPEIIDIILKSLPTIITELSKALPQIVKSLADAIPGIVLAIADNADEIVLALVEGLIGSSGEIIASLVNSLLVEGGMERIIGALIAAMPRVAVALVQGLLRGMATAGLALGNAAVGAIVAAAQNIGRNIGAGFTNSIGGPMQSLFSGIGTTFSGQMFSGISGGFSVGSALSVQGITGALTGGASHLSGVLFGFTNQLPGVFGQASSQLQSAIGAAFSGNLGQLRDTIVGAYQRGFELIRDAFRDPLNTLRDAISKPFEPIIEFFRNFKIEIPGVGGGGGGGGISGAVSRATGGKIKLAEGGTIPMGFPNDTFGPAFLESDEMVVPGDDVAMLRKFLASQETAPRESGDWTVVAAMLGKIAALLAQPMTVETTAEVDGRAMADIILKLNRNNARLTA